MIIREARIEDINEIHNLGNDVEEFDTIEDVVTFWPKKILKNCIESNTDFILVAEDKNILGFTIVNYNPVFKKAIVENIFVSPKFRGQKIGQKLINELMKNLEKIDCEYVCILIGANNLDTIKFYEKMGFKRGISCAWMDKVLGKEFIR